MTKRSIVLGLCAIAVVAAAVAPQAIMAYRGDAGVRGPNYTADRHTAMTKAFANKDYNAWKALMNGQGRAAQVITAKNFGRFVEAHDLMLQGKTAESNAIKAELGLGQHGGSRNGMGQGCTR